MLIALSIFQKSTKNREGGGNIVSRWCNGWVNEMEAVIESLTAIKRAGAKIIITYYALMMKNWLIAVDNMPIN